MRTSSSILAAHQEGRHALRELQEEFPPGRWRSEFSRDRDRILYSTAFRRLSGKTQVFLPTAHDHLRTRLTHTLEVAQISRTIAENLGLDETLAEAIALGHDLGHTPFGHVGERTLNYIMSGCDELGSFQSRMSDRDKGFKHNHQSVRVACDLEQIYGHRGMNLTSFTLWGIRNHSKLRWGRCACHRRVMNDDDSTSDWCYLNRERAKCPHPEQYSLGFYDRYDSRVRTRNLEEAWSFEGFVVAIADEIAQRHHDIEDALVMQATDAKTLVEIIGHAFQPSFDSEDKRLFEKMANNQRTSLFLPYVSKLMVGMLTKRLTEQSEEVLAQFAEDHRVRSSRDFVTVHETVPVDAVERLVRFPADIAGADAQLKGFLKNTVLNSFDVQRMDGKGRFIIRRLVKAYITNPRQLHDSTIVRVFRAHEAPDDSDWPDPTPKELGEMRNRIDASELKSSSAFQIALLRGICDHIAGMTDNFALLEYQRLYE